MTTRIFCWEPQLLSVRMDLQFLLDFMVGERIVNLRQERVCGVERNNLDVLNGAEGVFVILERWQMPVPARILERVWQLPRMVIWRHDDIHLARRREY